MLYYDTEYGSAIAYNWGLGMFVSRKLPTVKSVRLWNSLTRNVFGIIKIKVLVHISTWHRFKW